MASAQRTDPKLWRKIKAQVMRSSKGGKKDQWSARKAQMAVQKYKAEGGGYRGNVSQDETDLHHWTEKHQESKSDKKGVDSGQHHLPKKVSSTGEGQSLLENSKNDLMKMAQKRQIHGRSKMNKKELAKALQTH